MNNRILIILSALLALVIVMAIGTGAFIANVNNANSVKRSENNGSIEMSNTADESKIPSDSDNLSIEKDSFDGSIIYEGVRYEVNTYIDTVLFLGIDSSNQSREGVGIKEGGRSDVIILFIIDNKNKTVTPLEINRDTMVSVDIYDNDGNFLTQGTEQLTMQYSYGTTVGKACNLTKEKISDLLGRTRIDNVISLTMEGIEPIVDSIGGVTLKLQSDETDLDPSYKEGAVITLDGAKAFEFVHNRDVSIRGSNIERMSRQTQFMVALFQNIKGKGNSIVETMEEAAGDYLYEDIDADSIDHLTHYEYAGEVLSLPGRNETSAQHDEFYVNEEKLTQVILDLFYIRS